MAPKKKSESEKQGAAVDVMSIMKGMDKTSELKSIALENKKPEDFVSTGLVSTDLILGGGHYGGQVLQSYGAEHSGKSTWGYTGAGYVTRELKIPCAFLDYEGTIDRKLTAGPGIGVDYDRVAYYRPKTGEYGYRWITEFCESLPDKHFGLPQAVIYIDTIKAMKPQAYVDNPENKQPGVEAKMHSRGVQDWQTLITNKHVSIVALNQVRSNVGALYQSPEVQPGGNGWKFCTTNLLRLGRGKVIQLPNGAYFQEVRFKTYKNKNFVPLQECTVHIELGLGFDVASDVMEFCRLAGYLYKRGKGGALVKKGGRPSIRGLDDLLKAHGYEGAIEADGDYNSAKELEDQIREWGRTGPFWTACRLSLSTGEGPTRLKSQNLDESEKEDEALTATKRIKKNAVADADTEATDVDEFSPEETEVAPLGKARKSA